MREYFNASEHILSLKAAADAALQTDYTDLRNVSFNIPLIRKKLTNLDTQLMDDVVEEVDTALTAVNVPEGIT